MGGLLDRRCGARRRCVVERVVARAWRCSARTRARRAATSWSATPWVSNSTGASPGPVDRRRCRPATSCNSIALGPVETSRRGGLDQVAALDAAADDVVAHHSWRSARRRRDRSRSGRTSSRRRRRSARGRRRPMPGTAVSGSGVTVTITSAPSTAVVAIVRGDGGDAAGSRAGRPVASAACGRRSWTRTSADAGSSAASICRWGQPCRPAPTTRLRRSVRAGRSARIAECARGRRAQPGQRVAVERAQQRPSMSNSTLTNVNRPALVA